MQARSKALDILRATAIFLVLGNHLLKAAPANYGFLHTLTTAWRTGGWTGVDLFFVLSGFLISGLLFKEHLRHGQISFKHFFIRRGFKIYPAFYVMMILTYVFFIATRHPIPFKHLFPWFFFLQDYFYPSSKILFPWWAHTWSLAVEEQFYIFVPVLLILLARWIKNRPFTWIPAIFWSVAALCLVLRLWTHFSLPAFDPLIQKIPFHLRLDSLFFGVLISYYAHYSPEGFKKWTLRLKGGLFTMGLILFTVVFLTPEKTAWVHTFGYALLYLASGLLLCSMIHHDFKSRFSKVMADVGVYSYSIYLWHAPMMQFTQPLLTHNYLPALNWIFYALVYFAGSMLGGILMSKIIEYPILKLRDRLYPSRSEPANNAVSGM